MSCYPATGTEPLHAPPLSAWSLPSPVGPYRLGASRYFARSFFTESLYHLLSDCPLFVDMTEPTVEMLADELRPRLMRIVVALRREMRAAHVPPAQSAVLSALLVRGPMRVSDLARNEGVRLPTMTQIVGRMVDAELIARSAPVGSYNNMIQITDEGRAVAGKLAAQRTAALGKRMEGLTPEELQTVIAMFPIIDKMFKREPWLDHE